MRWLYSMTDSIDMNLSKFQGVVKDRVAWCVAIIGLQRVGHDLVTEHTWRAIAEHTWRAIAPIAWNDESTAWILQSTHDYHIP